MLWIALCLVAALSSVMAVAINKKLLGTVSEIKVASLYFIFTFLLLTPLVPFLAETSDFSLLSAGLVALIAFNGFLNVAAVYIYMKAIKCGDMSTVVPIRNTTPLFTAFLAAIFISEAITANVVAASLLIVFGAAALNYRKDMRLQSSNAAELKASVYALIVAIMAAFVFVIMKYCVSVISPILFIYVSVFFSSAIALLILAQKKKIRRFAEIARINLKYFFMVGLLTTIASLAIPYAASLEKASVISPFLRVELLFSLLVGYMFFGEKITKSKILGALLIFIGLLLVIS